MGIGTPHIRLVGLIGAVFIVVGAAIGTGNAGRAQQTEAGCHERDVLMAWIAEWPPEHKLVIDDDLVVLFTYTHPARLWAETASVYDRSSLSCIDLNTDGEVARRVDGNDDGRQRLDRVLADDALMQHIRNLIPWDSRAKPTQLA